MTDYLGQQLGNYRLTRLIGQGGFAEVYLGEHVRLSMKAAVKILHTHLAGEEIRAFHQEAQIIADLKHPHIIRVLDFDVQTGRPFLVLDYAPNGSLRQKYPRGTRLPLPLIAGYAAQIASALQYAHDRKLIHRDIKPENMLIGEQGEILLSDFGIATIAHSTSSMNTQASMGTLAYMPPEQIQGKPRKESDQYALAVTVYQWLTGELPFQGSSTEMIAQHLAVAPPSLHSKVAELPVELEQVVLKALAKDPRERFESVLAFATALEQSIKQPGAHIQQTQGFSATQPASVSPVVAPTMSANVASPVPMETPAAYAQVTPPVPSYPPYPLYGQSPISLQSKQSSGKIIFTWGLISGVIMLGIWIIFSIFPIILPYIYIPLPLPGGLKDNIVFLAILTVPCFFAGLLTARKTGKISSGLLACLIANLFNCVFGVSYHLIANLVARPFTLDPIEILKYDLLELATTAIFAVGLGALGGLIGRASAPKSNTADASAQQDTQLTAQYHLGSLLQTFHTKGVGQAIAGGIAVIIFAAILLIGGRAVGVTGSGLFLTSGSCVIAAIVWMIKATNSKGQRVQVFMNGLISQTNQDQMIVVRWDEILLLSFATSATLTAKNGESVVLQPTLERIDELKRLIQHEVNRVQGSR